MGGGEPLGGGRGLHHLQPAPAQRGLGQGGADPAAEPGQPVADAQEDQRPLMACPPSGRLPRVRLPPCLVRRAARRPPGARAATGSGRWPRGGADGAEHRAGLDHGVAPAPQPADQVALDGRVDVPDPGRRRGARTRGAEASGRAAASAIRASSVSSPATVSEPSGRNPMPGAVAGDLLPQPPGPQGQLQLGAAGPPAHPDEPEVADRGPAGTGVGLEVDDLPAAAAGLEGVHGADDPPAHDHHPFHAHLRSIVVTARWAGDRRRSEPGSTTRADGPASGPVPGWAKLTVRPFGGGATGSAHDSGS